jgi:phage portal protein BeeE
MLLEGGLEWQAMSLSPAQMDWIEGRHVSAREIALVYGVPPQVLGIPGDSTYSNYQEARQALYQDTILPLLGNVCDGLNSWLSPLYGENVMIVPYIEELPAMAGVREKRWNAISQSTWMTTNEKRIATGLPPVQDPEADKILIPSGLMPLNTIDEDIDGDETMPTDDEKPEDEKPEDDEDEKPEDDEDEESDSTDKVPKK